MKKTIIRIWDVNFANGSVITNKGMFTIDQWFVIASRMSQYCITAYVSECGQLDAMYYSNGEVRKVNNGWLIPSCILNNL